MPHAAAASHLLQQTLAHTLGLWSPWALCRVQQESPCSTRVLQSPTTHPSWAVLPTAWLSASILGHSCVSAEIHVLGRLPCFCSLLLCIILLQTALAYLMWPLTASGTCSSGFYYCSYNVYLTLCLFPLVEAFPHILKEAVVHGSVLLISSLHQMSAGEAFLCFQASATVGSCAESRWTSRGYLCTKSKRAYRYHHLCFRASVHVQMRLSHQTNPFFNVRGNATSKFQKKKKKKKAKVAGFAWEDLIDSSSYEIWSPGPTDVRAVTLQLTRGCCTD